MYDWSGTKQLFDPNIIKKKTISEIWSWQDVTTK
jgi:hypothetical protein